MNQSPNSVCSFFSPPLSQLLEYVTTKHYTSLKFHHVLQPFQTEIFPVRPLRFEKHAVRSRDRIAVTWNKQLTDRLPTQIVFPISLWNSSQLLVLFEAIFDWYVL
jgi:hypothetical protein